MRLPGLVMATVMVLLVTACTAANDAGAVDELRPNVLIVVTDDQPLGMMGAMPHTQRWLGSGARYTNAVASTPLCCPARATILSGRYVHNHGVRTLDQAYRFDFGQSLPNELQKADYLTGIAGKYFNGWNVHADDPRDFDRFSIFEAGYSDAVRSDPQTHNQIVSEGAPPVSESNDTTATVREAGMAMLRDFEATDEQPWMLYLAPFAPHSPIGRSEDDGGYGTAPRLRVRGERDLADKPPHVRDVTRSHHTSSPKYEDYERMYRALRPVDQMMVDVRAQLEASGELDNTLVIFTSDNGYLLGQHGLFGKREPYDESVRVPLMVWWPGHVPEGEDDRITGLVDIAPTVYDATGVSPGYAVDGQSMFGPDRRRRILIEHSGGGSWDHNVGDWIGWWAPYALYRRSFYADRGSKACFDGRQQTICQRYRRAPGREELYRGRTQIQNLLQHGATSKAHRRWTAAASRCAGARCHRLESTLWPAVQAEPWVRVQYRGQGRFRAGKARTVRVVARNVSDRRLRAVRLLLEANPQWTARPLSKRWFHRMRPGQRITTTWRVRFHGTGAVSLSTQARFRAAGGQRVAWDAAPVRVRYR